ncbi:MAG TPA: substrate-binding domain-containing protein [Nevskiaceae bacterium]|nr:substrate-binding domain-containing protein [Nevskiaceae bacterium]
MTFKFKPAVLAVVASTAASFAANAASPTLYGGGATFPAIAYVGPSWESQSPQARLSKPADSGSLFGAYTARTGGAPAAGFPMVSYCQTGSGAGVKVLNGVLLATGSCSDYGTGSPAPAGFSGANSEPDFVASDSPLTSTDYNTFMGAKHAAHNEPVQMPSVAGTVAIVYRNDSITAAKINLTESQICSIFSGAVTNWHQLSTAYKSKQIKVIFRRDSSGTSFGFTNHLSSVCPTAEPVAQVDVFNTTKQFLPDNSTTGDGEQPTPGATTSGTAFLANAVPASPAVFLGYSGNGGVVNGVAATDGAIGYAEAADVIARENAGGASVKHATVSLKPDVDSTHKYSKYDPISKAVTYALPSGSVLTDEIISGNDSHGRPVLKMITDATSGVSSGNYPSQADCVVIVDPSGYATAATHVNGAGLTDYVGYPINIVTYLMTYNTGNGADASNVYNLMYAPYYNGVQADSSKFRSSVTTIGANTGFAYLAGVTLPSPNTTAQTHLKACILK